MEEQLKQKQTGLDQKFIEQDWEQTTMIATAASQCQCHFSEHFLSLSTRPILAEALLTFRGAWSSTTCACQLGTMYVTTYTALPSENFKS